MDGEDIIIPLAHVVVNMILSSGVEILIAPLLVERCQEEEEQQRPLRLLNHHLLHENKHRHPPLPQQHRQLHQEEELLPNRGYWRNIWDRPMTFLAMRHREEEREELELVVVVAVEVDHCLARPPLLVMSALRIRHEELHEL